MNEINLDVDGKIYMVTDMNNNNKYSRAKTDAGANATQKQILAHYDKRGGHIEDETGNKIENNQFWKEEKMLIAVKQKQKENLKLIEKVTQHPIVSGLIVIVIVWLISSFFKKDAYIGFYYPDASNLMNDIQSGETFNSLDACRNWISKQKSIYNPNDVNYDDYECGKKL